MIRDAPGIPVYAAPANAVGRPAYDSASAAARWKAENTPVHIAPEAETNN